LLGPGEYGRVSVAVAVMTILNTVHSTGLPQAVSRHVAGRPADATAVLATALSLQVRATAATGALMAVAGVLLVLSGDPLGTYLAVAALTIVPHGLLNLHMAYDNGQHEFRRQALLLVAYSVAKTVLVIVLGVLYRGLGALAGYAAASLGVLLAGRHRPVHGPRFSSSHLVGFAAPVIALVGLSTTQLNIDLLLVQAQGGSPQETGWYAAVQQVARAPYLALTGLGMALLPVVARREAQADRSALRQTVRQAIRFTLLLLAPALAVLCVSAPAVIELIYGADYGPGASALPVLMPGMAAVTVFSLLGTVLTGMGRPWAAVTIAAVALGVTIAAGLVLIPPLGLVGAAIATTLGAILAAVGVLAVLVPDLGALILPVTAARIAIAGLAMAALLGIAQPSGLGLIVVAAVGTALYGGILVGLREVDRDDFRRVMRVVGREPA
jgi:stage V sporulation protein B